MSKTEYRGSTMGNIYLAQALMIISLKMIDIYVIASSDDFPTDAVVHVAVAPRPGLIDGHAR